MSILIKKSKSNQNQLQIFRTLCDKLNNSKAISLKFSEEIRDQTEGKIHSKIVTQIYQIISEYAFGVDRFDLLKILLEIFQTPNNKETIQSIKLG